MGAAKLKTQTHASHEVRSHQDIVLSRRHAAAGTVIANPAGETAPLTLRLTTRTAAGPSKINRCRIALSSCAGVINRQPRICITLHAGEAPAQP